MKQETFASERLIFQREAQEEMAQEMRLLIEEHSEEEGLQWTGSMTDLMEILYYVFETGIVCDAYGQPYTFAELVRRSCRMLHVVPSANPYVIAYRGCRRKGMKQQNFLERYCFRKKNADADSSNLMSNYISYCKK